MYLRRNLGPERWGHIAGKRCNFMAPKAARSFLGGRPWMRIDVPNWLHCHRVDLSNLGVGKESPICPLLGFHSLLVDPLGRVGVPADFHVFAKLFVTDCPAFGEESFNLLEDEGVSFNCSRAVQLRKCSVLGNLFIPNTFTTRIPFMGDYAESSASPVGSYGDLPRPQTNRLVVSREGTVHPPYLVPANTCAADAS